MNLPHSNPSSHPHRFLISEGPSVRFPLNQDIVAHLAGDDTTALAEAQASIELYAQHDQGAGVAELSAWAALTLLRLGRPEEVSQLPWPDPVVGSTTLQAVAARLRVATENDLPSFADLEADAADEDVLLVRGLVASAEA